MILRRGVLSASLHESMNFIICRVVEDPGITYSDSVKTEPSNETTITGSDFIAFMVITPRTFRGITNLVPNFL